MSDHVTSNNIKKTIDNNIKKTIDINCSNLTERIKWATSKPIKLKRKSNKTIKKQKEEEKKKEAQWGNFMIGQTNNKQWTTKLGEKLVYDILTLRGENPIEVEKKDGFKPDWETDEYIYEVKTSSWWVDGTAGEKVLGTWIKYQKIPELYGKPLRIVCVAYQEYELEYGKITYFGKNITPRTQEILNLAKLWNIEYIKFSDLISDFNYK
tara:strand:+ start:130 stop:756 length:627 start_codon:yes stop_codon:yes gene_type:complete